MGESHHSGKIRPRKAFLPTSCSLNRFFRYFCHREWKLIVEPILISATARHVTLPPLSTFFLSVLLSPNRQRQLTEKWAAGVFFPGPASPSSCCFGICKERPTETMLQKVDVTLSFVSTAPSSPSLLPFWGSPYTFLYISHCWSMEIYSSPKLSSNDSCTKWCMEIALGHGRKKSRSNFT